jgi:hypothetical protein
MDDSGLRERPSEQRMREAAALDRVTDFVTACPKDLTMYTAAAKVTGLEDQLVVSDLIELVARAVDLGEEVVPEPAAPEGSALLAAGVSALPAATGSVGA